MSNNTAGKQYETFASQRSELARLLGESSETISVLGMTSYQQKLEDLQAKVDADTFKVMVVGTFKNGKSTFINAFLGEDVLPAYTLPCTAVINEVKYGEKRRAILHFRDPLPEKLPKQLPERALTHMHKHGMVHIPPMEISYSDIEDYVVIPMGKDVSEMLLESPYEKVELFWPLELLKNGVEIIDSPGLNEHITRTNVTKNYLTKADAILMVLNAQALCSQTEMDFIENDLKEEGLDEPFFLINRFDEIPQREQERVKIYAQSKLKDYTRWAEEGIYYISALDALEGKQSNDGEKLRKSGMVEFEKRLSDYLTREKGRVKLSQPARELRRVLSDKALSEEIPMERQMLNKDLNEMKQLCENEKLKIRGLMEERDQVKKNLLDGIKDSWDDFHKAAQRYMDELIDKVPDWVDEFQPQNKFGLAPTKAKTELIVREISDYVSRKIDEDQRKWQKEKLSPLVERKAQEIFEKEKENVEKILSEIDQIKVDISGGVYDANPVPTWQRVLGIAGGLVLGDVGLAASAGMNGLGKELGKTFAVEIGAGILLNALGWLNPFTLCAMVVGTFLLNFKKSQSNAMDKLKKTIKEQIDKQLKGGARSMHENVANQITGKFDEAANLIVDSLDAEINGLREKMQAVIENMEQGSERIEARKAEINGCEEKIIALNEGLDNLIFQLAEE